MTGTSVYFWDGAEFQEFKNPRLESALYFTRLCGGPDRGLYVTQPGNEPKHGAVYHLAGEQATRITDFYYDPYVTYLGFYVTRNRRFLNWTKERVQLYSENAWHQLPVDTNDLRLDIFDLGQIIYLYRSGVLYCIDPNSNVTRKTIRTSGRESVERNALWDSDKIIFIGNKDGRPINAYTLAAGKPTRVDDINMALKSHQLVDLRSAPDGSVWLLADKYTSEGGLLIRLHPNGAVEPLRETIGLPWSERINDSMSPVLLRSDGSAWIGFNNAGVIVDANGQIAQGDYRNGEGPSNCLAIVEGPDQSIYAMSDWWIYAYREGQPQASNPYQTWPQVREALDRVWEFRPSKGHELKNAWQTGPFMVCSSHLVMQELMVTVLDARTGVQQFVMPLPYDIWARVWVTEGHAANTLLVLFYNHLQTVNMQTGQTIADIIYDHDTRIPPILIGNDYVVAKGYRGQKLVRINSSGEAVWSYSIFDYLRRPPARHESLMIAQTPLDGIRTIDMESGSLLWSDHVDAQGYGAVFTPNGDYTVEAACSMSPYTTQGWIIARNAKTGERLWHYRRPVNMVFHGPIIDPIRNQVYVVFQGGEVVCFDVRSGEVLWEVDLPDTVRPAEEPYWPSMAITGRLLTVIDRNDLIYILDADTGQVRARLDVTAKFLDNGIRLGSAGLVALPCIIGDLLIVSTKEAVTAYSLSGVLEPIRGSDALRQAGQTSGITRARR